MTDTHNDNENDRRITLFTLIKWTFIIIIGVFGVGFLIAFGFFGSGSGE